LGPYFDLGPSIPAKAEDLENNDLALDQFSYFSTLGTRVYRLNVTNDNSLDLI
jgi:hypothetical protein